MSIFGNTVYPETMNRLLELAAEVTKVVNETTNPRMTVELFVEVLKEDDAIRQSFELYRETVAAEERKEADQLASGYNGNTMDMVRCSAWGSGVDVCSRIRAINCGWIYHRDNRHR